MQKPKVGFTINYVFAILAITATQWHLILSERELIRTMQDLNAV